MTRAVLVAAIACASCTYDFDAYVPNGSSSDAAVDTSCTLDGGDGCYGTARGCGITCGAKRTACEATCSNNGCRNRCRDEETTCKSSCANDCTTCTKNLGCAMSARCVSETG